ncbi:MAG: DUF4139 domain-containing protein [Candidatus Glassbacteria bacterium]|nr:DUF4139 domain-containing protein [Candidatus Glassbacteria bacterium]
MLFILLLCAAAPGTAAAKARTLVASSAADGPRSLSLVVYNQDLALVREVRTVPRKEGLFELRFQDVARELVPNSVLVDTGEELKVLEQCYTYDLLSAGSLLEHFIGKTVILERLDKRTNTPEQVEGTLLSLEGGRIVRIGDRIEVDPEGRFILPEVPANLTDRPTLTWLVQGRSAGQSKVEVSYLTGGMGWRCDYVLSLAGDSDAGLSAWVTLDNRSGLDYPDCELTLVAGEISRVRQERPMVELMAVRAAGMSKAADEPRPEGFLREQLQDYYRYTLGRHIDIDNKQSKQVELFGLDRVKVERRYSLAGGRDFFYGRVAEPSRDLKVAMYLDWINGGGNYPGMPLPAGLVRIYRREPDGAMFFLGEDRIGHVPQEEKVSIRAGTAFDLTAERRQTEFTKLSDRLRQATVEITLTNRKKQDVAVEVEENLPGDWTMLEHSHEYLTIDAGRIRFSPRVRAGGKTTVKYTIKFM